MKHIGSITFILLVTLYSCSRTDRITHVDEYKQYLNKNDLVAKIETNRKELEFWEKQLARDSGSYVYKLELSNAYQRLFQLEGKIEYLVKSNQYLRSSSEKLANTEADILFALSQQSITQHKFKEASSFNDLAKKSKGDPYVINLLEFDTGMELGNYLESSNNLSAHTDKSSFDYLIRKSKLADHNGDIDEAINYMEQAYDKIKNRSNLLYCWALSNLGDMYGHAGRVEESYRAYLKVLEKDNTYLYALKGIAWIAFSYDRDPEAADKILKYITSTVVSPDCLLTLAEIEKYRGNKLQTESYINQFLSQVNQPGYGDMFNKYLIDIYLDRKNYSDAINLALREVENRPVTETYDWLAWSYYNSGDYEKAYALSYNHVWKRSFEPEVMFHTALIFYKMGKVSEAKLLLKECIQSKFELGPNLAKQIEELESKWGA